VPIRAASEWKSTVARGMAEEEDDPAGEGGVRRVTVRVAPVEVMSLARPSAEACLDPRAVRSTPAFSAREVAVSLVRGAKLEGEFEERCLASSTQAGRAAMPERPALDLQPARLRPRSRSYRFEVWRREKKGGGGGWRRADQASSPASQSVRAGQLELPSGAQRQRPSTVVQRRPRRRRQDTQGA
jgi:hypothetical protein